jgi:hypothetical protein
MSDLSHYETCACKNRKDEDGRPLKPDLMECGTCEFRWCARCHPCPSARSWCEGSKQHMDRQERLDELDAARALYHEQSKRYEIIKEVAAGMTSAADRDEIMDEAHRTLKAARKRLHKARKRA